MGENRDATDDLNQFEREEDDTGTEFDAKRGNEVSFGDSPGAERPIKSAGSAMATIVPSEGEVDGLDTLGEGLATRALELSLSKKDMEAIMQQAFQNPASEVRSPAVVTVGDGSSRAPQDEERRVEDGSEFNSTGKGRIEGEDILKTIDQIDGLMDRAQMLFEVSTHDAPSAEYEGGGLSQFEVGASENASRILEKIYPMAAANAVRLEEDQLTELRRSALSALKDAAIGGSLQNALSKWSEKNTFTKQISVQSCEAKVVASRGRSPEPKVGANVIKDNDCKSREVSPQPRNGERIEVFSNTMQKWLPGNIEAVESVEGDDMVKVVYSVDGKQFGKEVPYNHPHLRLSTSEQGLWDDIEKIRGEAATKIQSLQRGRYVRQQRRCVHKEEGDASLKEDNDYAHEELQGLREKRVGDLEDDDRQPVDPSTVLGTTNPNLDLAHANRLIAFPAERLSPADCVELLDDASYADVQTTLKSLTQQSRRVLEQAIFELQGFDSQEEEIKQRLDEYADQPSSADDAEAVVVEELLLGGASNKFTRSETEAVLLQAIQGADKLGEVSQDDLRERAKEMAFDLLSAANDGRLAFALEERRQQVDLGDTKSPGKAEWAETPIQNIRTGAIEMTGFAELNDQLVGDSSDVMQGLDQADAVGYTRDPSCKLSSTSLGRAHQDWAAKVLGTLATEGAIPVKRNKKGLKRLRTTSIIRELQSFSGLQGGASSPYSLVGQQSTNSIRSPLTSPGSSCFQRTTWTPPSPPAPSSTRTERTDTSQLQRSFSLPTIPATGFRLSPCSSANSHKASAAQICRAAVPELDMSRVRMGDDDDDTEDDPTGKFAPLCYHVGQRSDTSLSPGTKPDLPQLDMSAVQFDGTGSSHPSKLTRSSGTRNGPVAPRCTFAPEQKNQEPVATATSTGKEPVQLPRHSSDSAVKRLDFLEDGPPASVGALPQVIPGPKELAVVSPIPSAGKPGATGYPQSRGISYAIDTRGSIIAGNDASKKMLLGAPTAVRLPPVTKGSKSHGKKIISSHVHVHHHLHYHVKRTAAKLDLNTGPSQVR